MEAEMNLTGTLFDIRRGLICLLLVLLQGCGSSEDQTVTLDLWTMGKEGEVVQELIPAFERQHPGLKVRIQRIPWSAAHEKLLTAYAGDALPDVFQLGNTWIPEFVALRAIEPLDSRLAGSASVKREDFFPGILATNVLEGETYGVPWYVDTRLLFYRKDILEQVGFSKPPKTWEEWLKAMGRVKTLVGEDNYAILLPINEWQAPVLLALQRGAPLLKDNGQYGDFSGPAFRQAFTFYLDLFRHTLAPSLGETQIANLYQEFARGYFSLYITGPWNLGEFSQRLPKKLQDKWATAPLPGPDPAQPGLSFAGGSSLTIARASTRKEAAWKLVEFLSDPACQIEFYRLTGNLPAHRRAWQDPLLAQNPRVLAFWAQLQHVVATPKIPEWERIASLVARYSEAAIRGDMGVEESLAALDQEVDAVLEKRRWLLSQGLR
jgi:multiple sugar transport system substrate-binding protein